MHSFKRAWKNTALFLGLVLAVSLPLPVFYYEYSMKHWTRTTDIVEKNFYAGRIDTVFCGASHGYRAFIPADYDAKQETDSYNLCGVLQPMSGRVALLKEELERNPVQTVVIELSFNALSRDPDTEGAEGKIDVIRHLVNREDKVRYALRNLKADEWGIAYYMAVHNGFSIVEELIAGQAEENLAQSVSNRGYLGAEANDLSLAPTDYERQFRTVSVEEKAVEENLWDLNRIFELCREKNIDVFMVTVPLSYRMVNSMENLDAVRNRYEKLAGEQGCEFWDFNLWKGRETLFEDRKDFYDDLHLSESGAQKFTAIFAQAMQTKERGEDSGALFYDSYSAMTGTKEWKREWAKD